MQSGKTKHKGLSLFVVMSFMAIMFILCTDISMAAKAVRIWDSEGDSHRINKVLVLGVTKEATISYKLDDITEVSHAWSIDDSAVCSIQEDDEGYISLTGAGEGLTRLRLSVVADDEETYTDYTVISVFTPIETVNGVTNKSTLATRSAHSEDENKNKRDTLPKGTKVSIYGKCGAYYRATVSFDFTDENDSKDAFILASDIDIPVTSIKLSASSLTMQPKETAQLSATIEPALATDKKLKWESSKEKVASVNKNGVITAKIKGKTTITAKSSDGKVSASCTVNVSVVKPETAAPVEKSKKPKLTGNAMSLTGVELKVENGSKTSSDYYVAINGKKISASSYSITVGGKKLKNNRFKMKKGKTYKIKISNLGKNKTYKFDVETSGHKSNTVKITTGVPELTVTQRNKNLVLEWNKIKGASGYYIYRGTTAKKALSSNKPYKTINSESKLKFADKNCKKGKEYYYVVKAVKSTKKTPVVKGTVTDDTYNWNYAKNSPLFKNVALDNSKKWDANKYTLPNGSYPPIKYRFTGTVLEIHLYIDFVQYNMVSGELVRKNDPDEKLDGELCTTLFIKGLKKGYNKIEVTSGEGNFGGEGFNFKTKLIVHNARKETFASAQRFIQVRIGGLAPRFLPAMYPSDFNDYDGDLWFHASLYYTSDSEIGLPYIHMPTNAQLKENKGEYADTSRTADGYKGTAAHEMGHILGLYDAYTLEENGKKIDRCADNSETCKKVDINGKYAYYCLMKGGHQLEKTAMRANDFEMMLHAYSLGKDGIPFWDMQNYRTYYDEGTYYISDVIENTNDEKIEE
ncbi:MAG: Ig-like domain-containing protein [Mogibacterium sp.]|nr:Ig-like domain-containing protein [Mogibacterium sp.]